MKPLLKIPALLLLIIVLGCNQKTAPEPAAIRDEETDFKFEAPKADIAGFEGELNNGGFNQYFFNSSGQDCFETLRALRKEGKVETAKLLERAINVINPGNIPEKEFIEKLRNREVEELDDDNVNAELDKLDSLFYKYPDGSLTKE